MQTLRTLMGLVVPAIFVVACQPKAPEAPAAGGPQVAPALVPAGSGASCGSRGMAPCPGSEYCDFPAGSECGALDKGGVCRAPAHNCATIAKPVCGCDGATYPNACEAAVKGVSVAKDGPC